MSSTCLADSTKDSLVPAGLIGGCYGVKGWVKIRSFTEPQENLLGYRDLFLKYNKDTLEPLIIDTGRAHGKGLIAHIRGVDDRERARDLLGKQILIDIAGLPELHNDDYYWHQLVDLKVWCISSSERTLLGEVDHLLDTGANDVLVVRPCEGSLDAVERLIPYRLSDVVKKVDLVDRVLEVDWFHEE